MEDTRKTMAVYVGDLFALDRVFADLESVKTLSLPFSPKSYVHGTDVLLVSTGPRGTGGLYVVVGIARKTALSDDGNVLSFEEVERFPIPVVAVYERTDFHRASIMGTLKNWGPRNLYYLPEDAASEAEALATDVLSR